MTHAFRRIIRAQRIIARASELLEEEAESLKDSSTINGEWPDDERDTQAAYDEIVETAKGLRGLLK